MDDKRIQEIIEEIKSSTPAEGAAVNLNSESIEGNRAGLLLGAALLLEVAIGPEAEYENATVPTTYIGSIAANRDESADPDRPTPPTRIEKFRNSAIGIGCFLFALIAFVFGMNLIVRRWWIAAVVIGFFVAIFLGTFIASRLESWRKPSTS